MGKFVVANWKMNKTIKEARAFIHEFNAKLPKKCKNVVWEKNNNYLCIIHIIRVRLNETIKNHQIVYESRKRFT